MILKEVLSALFRKPNTKKSFTKANEFVPVSESYRGRILLDTELCIGCLLCIKSCPTGAISTAENKKVNIQLDQCIFCGQCRENCPKKAITFTADFLMVTQNRKELYTSTNKKSETTQ